MIPTLKIGDYLFVNKMRYSLRIPFTEIELFHIDDPQRGDIVTFVPAHEGGKNFVKRVMGMPGDRIRIRDIRLCDYYKAFNVANPQVDREFSCAPGARMLEVEPVIALVEYKEHDRGDWKNYGPLDISAASAKEILFDADNANVLHPDFQPVAAWQPPRVLLTENIPSGKHLVTEGPVPGRTDAFCSDIGTDGCVIPPGKYVMMGDNRDDSSDSRVFGFIDRQKILGKAVIIYFSINWRDSICEAFAGLEKDSNAPADLDRAFRLPDFTPDEQRRKCSHLDGSQQNESNLDFVRRTLMYRFSRISLRLERIGTLLK